MNQPAIQIKNFSFGYTSTQILHDIDLTITQGEYISIIGPNGAGKSTLLKCLNRIIKAGQGDIEIFGKNLNAYNQKELGGLMGYVPQIREYSFPYTVYDFVLMGRYPYLNPLSIPSSKDKDVVNEALELTALKHLAHRRVINLSGGERQKVYLAGALAQQPKILLLDEPTTHLDPKYQVDIQHLISSINTKLGVTIVQVTHDLNHIFSWSKSIVAIKNGHIELQGSADDILTLDRLNKIFDSEFQILKHPKTKKNIIVTEFSQ